MAQILLSKSLVNDDNTAKYSRSSRQSSLLRTCNEARIVRRSFGLRKLIASAVMSFLIFKIENSHRINLFITQKI